MLIKARNIFSYQLLPLLNDSDPSLGTFKVYVPLTSLRLFRTGDLRWRVQQAENHWSQGPMILWSLALGSTGPRALGPLDPLGPGPGPCVAIPLFHSPCAVIPILAQGTKGPTWSLFHSNPAPKGPRGPCGCLLYTSPSPRDATLSRMPSSA